ncbi:unnamed protein product [Candidula unifasciata]|uniref:Phosphatidylinositol-glycan biosynthesis class W protein n=1 Tax=Candidula unifasciata TaxID=100452 RepID=A0A8S3YN21_9EUPU|nr:unnamed protein product [Candidula unifasciata]
MTTYKLQHEMFVSGHSGTSYLEVAMVSSIACIGCFLRDLFILSKYKNIIRPGLFPDLILLVLPNIIGVTILSNHIGLFILTLLFLTFIFCSQVFRTGQDDNLPAARKYVNLSERKQFITNFRSIINLCTAISILAVDFRVFPRRLAKAETYGFGGMDVGVGLFVVANAVVSCEARGKGSRLPVWSQCRKALISSLPLLILGCARLLAVKGAGYHEHVTEYGVHWNFFFTLAALKISLTLVYCILPVEYSAAGAAVTVIGHQILLSAGLSSYIMIGLNGIGGRSGFIDANREGICSLPGYVAIYMFGVQLGRSLFKPRHNLKEWLVLSRQLTVTYIAVTVIMTVFHHAVEPVSRRFVNAAFVFWIMSVSTLMIVECLLAEITIAFIKSKLQNSQDQATYCIPQNSLNKAVQSIDQPPSEGIHGASRRTTSKTTVSASRKDIQTADNEKESKINKEHLSDTNVCLLEAISFNSLLFFLLANLFTGAVNMSISTIYASDAVAVVILILYMFLLCFVVVSLRKKNICTKVW